MDHVERVEGDRGGDQADGFVGVEELGGGEGAHDPAGEQPDAGDDEGAAGDEEGDDGGVGAAGLVVVADRVGERRPGELEAADEDVDRLRELDRQRVEAGLGEADGADDDDAVDEVEQVERDLGRHRRQAEAQQPPQQGGVEAQREAAPLQDDQAEDEGGAGRVAAEQEAAGALAGADHEDDGHRDRREDVEDRGDEVGAGALLEPEQGEQELEHRQHPEAADRDPRQLRPPGWSSSASEIGVGERQRDQGAEGGEPEEAGEGAGDDPRRGPRRPCSRSAAAASIRPKRTMMLAETTPANITSAAP